MDSKTEIRYNFDTKNGSTRTFKQFAELLKFALQTVLFDSLPPKNKKSAIPYGITVFLLVEPGRVELPSKNQFLSASPSAVTFLKFPHTVIR